MSRSSSDDEDEDWRPHNCRWAWCRLSFPDVYSLATHVVEDHIANEQPVKRADISTLRRIEEGVGESLIFTDVSWGSKNEYISRRETQTKSPQFSSFAALSSPTRTPPIPSLPPSPDIFTRVANAIKPRSTTLNHHVSDASLSSSTSSVGAVESQLTQIDAADCSRLQPDDDESDSDHEEYKHRLMDFLGGPRPTSPPTQLSQLNPHLHLQTQAPYQSQNFSESQ